VAIEVVMPSGTAPIGHDGSPDRLLRRIERLTKELKELEEQVCANTTYFWMM
jgi:hypothetical protein